MWNILKARRQQGRRTSTFPAEKPALPARFRGLLALHPERCEAGCGACAEACPTQAIDSSEKLTLDLGRCLFCNACVDACATEAITSSRDYRLTTTCREALVLDGAGLVLAERLSADIARRFGRSLAIRVVSAGGCAGCAAEVNALSNIVFDLSRFGIHIAASPRHADALIVTGVVSRVMSDAVVAVYRAIPAPKFVVAVGACAISGGPYRGSAQSNDGVASVLPVDLFIAGCPPHPYTLLDGMLRALGRSVP